MIWCNNTRFVLEFKLSFYPENVVHHELLSLSPMPSRKKMDASQSAAWPPRTIGKLSWWRFLYFLGIPFMANTPLSSFAALGKCKMFNPKMANNQNRGLEWQFQRNTLCLDCWAVVGQLLSAAFEVISKWDCLLKPISIWLMHFRPRTFRVLVIILSALMQSFVNIFWSATRIPKPRHWNTIAHFEMPFSLDSIWFV